MDFLSFSEILSPFECATHKPLVLFQWFIQLYYLELLCPLLRALPTNLLVMFKGSNLLS